MNKINWVFPRDLSTLALHSAIELEYNLNKKENPFSDSSISKLAKVIHMHSNENFMGPAKAIIFMDTFNLTNKEREQGIEYLQVQMNLFAKELNSIKSSTIEKIQEMKRYCITLNEIAVIDDGQKYSFTATA